MRVHPFFLLALAGAQPSCLGVADPGPIGEGRGVLFVGNSYLYYGDIPGIVQALSDSVGDPLTVETVAGPDLALVDHWNAGSAAREIRKGGWEWVILQQGPSSVEVNRDTLRLATRLFADEITRAGARPALFSAWPRESRRQDFPRAMESYRLAAAEVNGIFLPVASSWLAAWDRDPNLPLYADGLHPSTQGSYLSALVVCSRLLGRSPLGMPSTLKTRQGVIIVVDPEEAALLQAAAVQALQIPRPSR